MFHTLLLLTSAFASSLCNDGWVSPSTGPGTCSHHGGIAEGRDYYIPPSPPSTSNSQQLPTGSNYQAPLPADRLGSWELQTIAHDYWGQIFFVSREYTNYSPSLRFVTFDYACYPDRLGSNPPGELIQLTVSTFGGYLSNPPSARADESDPYLQVWSSNGAEFKRIYSWEVEVPRDGANIHFVKKTNNMSSPNQAEGVLYLTQEDIGTITLSDKLIVIVHTSNGYEDFEIPMSGAIANITIAKTYCLEYAKKNVGQYGVRDVL